ncbi:MAG: ABC transporter ATP-binding protein [Peptoniphilus sp.]|nr:ABC transporter ATP-binding protein [Peptoniphilus sp.]MDD7363084.1 ABC transporter ATP-binding protein [Bacillota bacterium]MDY6044412.1 ABC transporter ATP-binding protein [Peptoniphilus sp.]
MNIYKKLFAYVDREKYFGYLAGLLSAVSAFVTVFGYFYIYRFLRDLVVEGNVASADGLAAKAAIVLTSGAVLYIASGYFSHILGFRLETNLRKRGIDGLEGASFRFFDLNPTGKIRKIIDDNAAQTHQVVAHLIPDSAQAFLVPAFAIMLGFIIDLRVGLTLLALTIVSGLIIAHMMGGEDGFMKIYQDALATLSAETVEYVRGMQVVKIFGADVQSFKALYKAIRDYSKYAYEYALSCKKPYVSFQWLLFGLIAILMIPVALWTDRLGDPAVLVTDLVMIFLLSGVLFVSYMRIMWVGMYIFQGNYAVDTLEALYADMQADNLTFGDEDVFKNHDIAFEHVTFSYNETPVLEDLSFTLEEGKSYALVGSSGSGKSTIAKLISGFYKVDQGAIKIGGKPLERYSRKAIIGAISFVFQDPKLFKTSIYDNVALAKKGASRKEVLRALHLAGCDAILEKFPERERTVIGSEGVYLSGGEKQRVAIARAMLKDSDIIIMDEASAAIDPDNEHELQKAFKNLIRKKTVIMIAHRLSSIRAVDEILVLDKGKIIERGTDAELMCRDSKYKYLMNQYNRANDWRVGYEGVL